MNHKTIADKIRKLAECWQPGKLLTIIANELDPPIVDGSAEWALWQMMQGEHVIHEGLTPCNIHCNMVTWLDSPESKYYTMQSPNKWLMYCPFKDGWQLYEPKPKTQPCPTCNGTGVVMHKTANAATQTPLTVSDATQIKVGDWVEIEHNGECYHRQVISIDGKEVRVPFGSGKMLLASIGKENILGVKTIRKLSPSEVIVKIGCLEGTVERHDGNPQYWFKLRSSEYNYALISIDMLDTPTRELVESLIKAQEEK